MAKPFAYKQEILQSVGSDHLTADDIFQKLVLQYPNLGKGALYRNLDHLVQEGELMKVLGLKKACIYEKK